MSIGKGKPFIAGEIPSIGDGSIEERVFGKVIQAIRPIITNIDNEFRRLNRELETLKASSPVRVTHNSETLEDLEYAVMLARGLTLDEIEFAKEQAKKGIEEAKSNMLDTEEDKSEATKPTESNQDEVS